MSVSVVLGDMIAELTKEDIFEFREERLRAKRFWRTGFGERLLLWFWQRRIGHWFRSRFQNATPRELRGYQFWGPVGLFITAVELLGLGKIASFDYWPTISTTVGDLQDRDSRWGLVVVGLIVLAAFYAVAYQRANEVRASEYVFNGVPGTPGAVGYSWKLVYAATIAVAVIAGVLIDNTTVVAGVVVDNPDAKIHRGYAIYSTLALVALVIPFAFAIPWWGRHRVAFPNLFFTFSALRARFAPVAAFAVALLAILILHLALYPWPDLARTPGRFAGFSAREAREQATARLRSVRSSTRGFAFSTSQRSVYDGQDAWHVHFNALVNGEPSYRGCYVIVRARHSPTVSDGCRH